MKTISIDDITQAKFDEQEAVMINMIRAKYPRLDLRSGTVLRDLLVKPDSAVGSVFSMQAEEQRNCSSIQRLLEREEAGEEIDAEDVNAILSNFNMESISGTPATGVVKVVVSNENNCTLLEGFEFSTITGETFRVTKTTTATLSPIDDSQTRLFDNVTSYWFLVQVECTENGSAGNIGQGTALEPDGEIMYFVSATAYGTFSGGSDVEDLSKTVGRIKQSLSVRGLVNRTAIESQLRDAFDGTEHPIVAISVCGYGNEAQRRDKHNAFGVAVGGRSDIYVRNFTYLPTVSITAEGTLDESGKYSITIPASVTPGMYAVYRVSDPETDALASYLHEDVWFADGVEGTWHDIDVSKSPAEVFGTVYRGVRILVSETGSEEPEKTFRVELVAAPDLSRIQAYLDSDSVRNTGSDFIARTPVVVNVSISAVARYEYSSSFDPQSAISKICEYVNTSGFTGRLTRSEIATILKNMGAKSVDLFNENEMLYGYGYDAYGRMFELHGDALDADNVRSGEGMVTRDTCVFVVNPENVQIKAIPVQ